MVISAGESGQARGQACGPQVPGVRSHLYQGLQIHSTARVAKNCFSPSPLSPALRSHVIDRQEVESK